MACDGDYHTSAERWALFYVEHMPDLMRRFDAQQQRYFATHDRYAKRLQELGFTSDSAFDLRIAYSSDTGWIIGVTHPGAPGGHCEMWVGAAPHASRPRRGFELQDDHFNIANIEEAAEAVPERATRIIFCLRGTDLLRS